MTTVKEAHNSIWMQIEAENNRRILDGRPLVSWNTKEGIIGVFVDYHTFYKELLTDPEREGWGVLQTYNNVQTICGLPLFLVQQRGTPLQPPVLVVFN